MDINQVYNIKPKITNIAIESSLSENTYSWLKFVIQIKQILILDILSNLGQKTTIFSKDISVASSLSYSSVILQEF